MSRELLERIERRLQATGISAAAASVAAGMSKDAIRNFKRRPDASMSLSSIEKLAPILKTTPGWLGSGEGEEEAEPDTDRPPASGHKPILRGEIEPVAALNLSVLREAMPQDLAVLGTMAGSFVSNAHLQSFEIEGRVIEYVRRPPALMTVPDAYALYVLGDSMSPEHKAGELRFIHPHKPARSGDGVVVQAAISPERAYEAYLGNFVRRTATKIVIAKLNPAAEVEFPLEYVRSVHRVLTMNELFGL